MADSAYFVKSSPLRAFFGSFQQFADMLQTYWRYAWRSLMQKKYFLTNLQGFLLSHFSMTAPSNWWLIVCTLWNQLLFRAFIGSFQHFESMLQTYWRCAWRSLMQKKIFLTFWQTYRVFSLAIFSTLWRYVADKLKICMKKFDAEKIFFDKQYVAGIK